MSVIIKKIQNTNESNTKTNGKWYPRVVNIGTMNLDALCEHIQEHGSLWTEDVVTGVVKKFVRCIQEQLLESRKVKLDGLGTFYLKARLKVGNGEEGKANCCPKGSKFIRSQNCCAPTGHPAAQRRYQ
jgi:predicted histone-like DNA-binding protein